MKILGCRQSALTMSPKLSLSLLEFIDNSVVDVVFTQNAFAAAPVLLARENLVYAIPKYALINKGCANAATGDLGLSDARQINQEFANLVGGLASDILPFSTGVIGQRLPVADILQALPDLHANLAEDRWQEMAEAILTTDTVRKIHHRKVGEVSVMGVAKGSGMIHPNMATMLAFVVTDAIIDSTHIKRINIEQTASSFNAITVDGDTSTNDACLLAATQQAQAPLKDVEIAISEIYHALAEDIVHDGEGATKQIIIRVQQALSEQEAKQVAMSIATSPLVKTAIFAGDANWGRIISAIGASGAYIVPDKVKLSLGDNPVFVDGKIVSSYTEQQGAEILAKKKIYLNVDLGVGKADFIVQTCDLTPEYISINANYRS